MSWVWAAAWDQFVAGNSFLSEMQRLERAELPGVFSFAPEDLRALVAAGVRIMVINREYLPVAVEGLADAYAEINTAAFGAPIASDRRARAWDLGNWDGRSSYVFTTFSWPTGVAPGGPTLAIQGYRLPSMGFSIPAPVGGAPPPRR